MVCGDACSTRLQHSLFFSSLQMMYFQFSERPEEMFEKNLEFKVLNAQILHIRNILLGSFKVATAALNSVSSHSPPPHFSFLECQMFVH